MGRGLRGWRPERLKATPCKDPRRAGANEGESGLGAPTWGARPLARRCCCTARFHTLFHTPFHTLFHTSTHCCPGHLKLLVCVMFYSPGVAKRGARGPPTPNREGRTRKQAPKPPRARPSPCQGTKSTLGLPSGRRRGGGLVVRSSLSYMWPCPSNGAVTVAAPR